MLDPASLGFDLNSRETAILIYTSAFIVWVAFYSKVRRSAVEVLRALFQRPILITLGTMSAYVVACVVLLGLFEFWTWANLKTTLVWWVTFAFVSMFEANKVTEERGRLRRMAREALSITVIIELIGGFHTFPLWGEMLLVPFVTLVGLMLAVAQNRPENAILVRPLTNLQIAIGLGVLGFGIYSVARDFREFATLDTARDFAVPVILSLMFLPFLYGLAVVMAHETIFTSLRLQQEDWGLVGYAQRKSIRSFGLDIDGVKRLTRSMHMDSIGDRAGIDAAIAEIKRLKKRERNPPPVPPTLGWSPYEAGRFLAEYDIVTRDYHRSFDGWWAEAPSVRLGDRPRPDHISYYIGGTEQAATRLRLALDASYQNDPAEADRAFYERVKTLLCRIFGDGQADALLVRVMSADEQTFQVDGKRITLERDERGIAQRGGYGRNFIVLHQAHVESALN